MSLRSKESGPSVDWVSSALGRVWEALADPGEGLMCAFEDPEIVVVQPEHGRKAAVWTTNNPSRFGPATRSGMVVGSLPELAEDPAVAQYQLERIEIPGTTWLRGPRWPWCCGRLTRIVAMHGEDAEGPVLTVIESAVGPLQGGVLLEPGLTDIDAQAELTRARQGKTDGLVIYHCPECGRVYLGSVEP